MVLNYLINFCNRKKLHEEVTVVGFKFYAFVIIFYIFFYEEVTVVGFKSWLIKTPSLLKLYEVITVFVFKFTFTFVFLKII